MDSSHITGQAIGSSHCRISFICGNQSSEEVRWLTMGVEVDSSCSCGSRSCNCSSIGGSIGGSSKISNSGGDFFSSGSCRSCSGSSSSSSSSCSST